MHSYSTSYDFVFNELGRRLSEQPPTRIQLLAGPRQVGKTTLLLALEKKAKGKARYMALDAPHTTTMEAWSRLWAEVEQVAQTTPIQVFLDEIHHLREWNRLLKVAFDEILRRQLPVHIVATGSSSLRMAAGSRESMAGRFEKLSLSHWGATALADVFKLPVQEAIRHYVASGSFPGAVQYLHDPTRWREYIRQSVMEPAIDRDVLVLEAVRKPALLRQTAVIAFGHPAEIISLQKICGQLAEKGAMETISHYLQMLEEAYLVAAIPKYSEKLARQRAAPPKLVPLSNAFVNVSSLRVPSATTDPERWGRWVENACIAFARNEGQTVYYWRQEPLEVDFIVDGSWGQWAVEVKTGAFSHHDLEGLLTFCRIHKEFCPMVLCDAKFSGIPKQALVACMPWQDYLLHGLTATP